MHSVWAMRYAYDSNVSINKLESKAHIQVSSIQISPGNKIQKCFVTPGAWNYQISYVRSATAEFFFWHRIMAATVIHNITEFREDAEIRHSRRWCPRIGESIYAVYVTILLSLVNVCFSIRANHIVQLSNLKQKQMIAKWLSKIRDKNWRCNEVIDMV